MLMLFLAIEDDNNREFITALYKEYYPVMKKKTYDITHDYGIVDDLINDAFIKLIDKISILKEMDCCKQASYIVHTIRNISFNYVKHRSVENNRQYIGEEVDISEYIADTTVTAEELYIIHEEYEHLGKVINDLSERDRELLYNKYIFELSDKEISKLMDIPVNNIREYLVRARRRALKLLNDDNN